MIYPILLSAIVFLLGLIFSTTGLQDWWPALLKNWVDTTLYKDINFYTGPLYPVLLKLTAYIFPAEFAPKILGSIITTLYVLSAFAMFKSYLNRAEIQVNHKIRESYLLLALSFFLVISRYLTIYLVPDDYHTLSLLTYCLIINKFIAPKGHFGKETIIDRLSSLLRRIPMPFLIAALLLNRLHEGIIFLALYPIYMVLRTGEQSNFPKIALKQYTKEIVLTVLVIVLFFTIASPIFNIANIYETFRYLIVEAPKSKSFGSDNYFLKLSENFWNVALGQISPMQLKLNLSFLVVLIISYRFPLTQNLTSKYARFAYCIVVIFFIIIGMNASIRGSANLYRLIIDSILLVIFVQFALSGYVVFWKKELSHKIDFSYIPILSLFCAHLLSTSGIINEPLLIVYLPSLIFNLFIINEKTFVNPIFKTYFTLVFFVAIGYTVTSKVISPRRWWLVTEVPVYANRQLMVGDKFKRDFPNLTESLAYADLNLLIKSNELCSFLNDSAPDDQILSYPVPYYSFACKSSNKTSSFTADFTYWYDVSGEKRIEVLQSDLLSNASQPRYLAIVSNSLALIGTASYYSPSDAESYYQFKFANFLLEFAKHKYAMVYKYYMINGNIVFDNKSLDQLNALDSKGCFQPDKFISCRNDINSKLKSEDITAVYLFKRLPTKLN